MFGVLKWILNNHVLQGLQSQRLVCHYTCMLRFTEMLLILLWELIFVERQFPGIYFRRRRLFEMSENKFPSKLTRYTVSTRRKKRVWSHSITQVDLDTSKPPSVDFFDLKVIHNSKFALGKVLICLRIQLAYTKRAKEINTSALRGVKNDLRNGTRPDPLFSTGA